MGGGGAVRPPPRGFLPFTQYIFIFRQPIPENSGLFPTFYCGCRDKKEKKYKNLVQSNFGIHSTRIFFFALIKKIFLYPFFRLAKRPSGTLFSFSTVHPVSRYLVLIFRGGKYSLEGFFLKFTLFNKRY